MSGSTRKTLVRLWPFVAPEKRRLAIAFALNVALTVVEVATPIMFGFLVDDLLARLNGNAAELHYSRREIVLLAALVVAAPLRGLLLAKQRSMEGELGQRVTARIRERLWDHVQRLPVAYADRRGPGRLLLRFIGDGRAIQRIVGPGLVRLSQDLLLAVGVLVALAILNWRMSLVIVALVPLQTLIFWRLNPTLRDRSVARRRSRSRLSGYLASRAAGLTTAKPALQNEAEIGRFDTANRSIRRRGSEVSTTAGTILGLSATTVALAAVGVLVIATLEAEAGRLTAGTFVTYFALIGLLTPVFDRVAMANRSFQEGGISVDRIHQTLAQRPESGGEHAAPLRVTQGTLVVDSLVFGYGAESPVLRGVSFEARRGEIVAIIGANGAGKSTLVELLLRHREPAAGRITIDGQDIAGVVPDSLRAQIGFVPQDPPLFDGTAAVNVSIGTTGDVPMADLERAARLSGADEVIARLPDGWETKLAEGRRRLSQGERQRFALARALLADPPILILNEPSEALDAAAQRAFAGRLRQLARTKTVVVAGVALPASLLPDRTYLLEGGRLVEVASNVADDVSGRAITTRPGDRVGTAEAFLAGV